MADAGKTPREYDKPNGGNQNMGKSLTRKIIESHFVSGDMTPGKEILSRWIRH